MSYNPQKYVSETPVRVLNISEFCQEYAEWIEESGLLLLRGCRYTSEGKFYSDLWILLDDVSKTHLYLDWSRFMFMVNVGILTADEISIIKCWFVSSMRDGLGKKTLERMYIAILSIVDVTKNFNVDALNTDDGDVISSTFRNQHNHINYYISQYIDFLDNIDLVKKGHIIVIEKLLSLKMYEKSGIRALPKSKDIFALNHYIKRFFNEETNENLKYFYMPILLWWKITNVIPMRPSEFTYKLSRNCLSEEDDEYFLHIGRIKVSTPNPERNDARIPLLDKIKITKEIYDLITRYINITSFDTNSKTLISYSALQHFRKEILKDKRASENKFRLRHVTHVKKYLDTFTRSNLEDLLNSFYDVVIECYYKDNSIEERLSPGDTRHLAFMSLLLQGVSPIEIAMLGGHTTLEAQSSYTGHIEYYIDSEILNFIGNFNIEKNSSSKSLKEIIFCKPHTCPKLIVDCSATEDGIGYCTVDFESGEDICDNVEQCIFCSKWWCEPINDNYIKAKKYIEENYLWPMQKVVLEEQQFLMKLFTESQILNIEGLLQIDNNSENEIRQATLKLHSTADKIISYKKALLDMFGNKTVSLDK